jgi:uncharacterized protein (TIRG00374 family)
LLFTDFGLSGTKFIVVFGIIYILWGISFTINDISYWSMLPSLSQDLREREQMGSIARICASVGLFSVVTLIVPITEMLGGIFGSLQKGYFVLAIIILQGSVLMLFNSSATTMQLLKNFVLIVGMCGVCAVVTAFLFNDEWRSKCLRKAFRMVNKVLFHVFRALIPKGKYDDFMDQLDEGIDLIHKKKKKMTWTIIYICADWLFTILVLYFAFRAVGVHISTGVLVAGFAVGMVTTLIPILPGGLGAMELAMTAVYSQMGIDWDAALMATLIYRVVYYLIPGIVSIFIYWGLQLSSPVRTRQPKGVRHERTH